jgi:hypothetical protein
MQRLEASLARPFPTCITWEDSAGSAISRLRRNDEYQAVVTKGVSFPFRPARSLALSHVALRTHFTISREREWLHMEGSHESYLSNCLQEWVKDGYLEPTTREASLGSVAKETARQFSHLYSHLPSKCNRAFLTLEVYADVQKTSPVTLVPHVDFASDVESIDNSTRAITVLWSEDARIGTCFFARELFPKSRWVWNEEQSFGFFGEMNEVKREIESLGTEVFARSRGIRSDQLYVLAPGEAAFYYAGRNEFSAVHSMFYVPEPRKSRIIGVIDVL